MAENLVMHLILGRWRTPNHSSAKALDDTHQIKKEILAQVGKRNYSRLVGNNPDLDISDSGIIVLKGIGKFRKNPIFSTNISADEHFVMRMIPISGNREIEIQICIICIQDELSSDETRIDPHFHQMYILPNDPDIIFKCIERIEQDYLQRGTNQIEQAMVFLVNKISIE